METDRSQLLVRPIGVIHSPFTEQKGTPVQPYSAKDTRGTVELSEAFTDGLLDLAGFERIWLIYWFDRARPAEMHVLPYRDTQKHGLFATRAPARVNPIGMSTVLLLGVEGRTLHVGEIDILDGTPLLDIKPYVPEYDAYTGVRVGWLTRDSVVKGPMTADGRFSQR
jgi:tRNA (adenine37-N6)-methyltransferase